MDTIWLQSFFAKQNKYKWYLKAEYMISNMLKIKDIHLRLIADYLPYKYNYNLLEKWYKAIWMMVLVAFYVF